MPVKKVLAKGQSSSGRKTQNSKLKSESSNVKTKTRVSQSSALSVPVFSLSGAASANFVLPKEVFGAKVNKNLLSQAIRVYLNNQKGHHSSTKTRSEVQGSTAKMGPQKGSGRARHGSKRAPIFVGGGIALGPKSRQVRLDLPKKMKTAALVSALSQRLQEKEVLGLSGLDKATGKTSQVAALMNKISKKHILLVTDESHGLMQRAVANLSRLSIISADQLNVMEVIKHQTLMLTKEAIGKLEFRVKRPESSEKEQKGTKQ